MSPTRFTYRDFGLELVSLDHSGRLKQTPMAGEKRDDGARYPIKSLLEEFLVQQRNKMMDSFTEILLQMLAAESASSMSIQFGDATPSRYKLYLVFFYLKARSM